MAKVVKMKKLYFKATKERNAYSIMVTVYDKVDNKIMKDVSFIDGTGKEVDEDNAIRLIKTYPDNFKSESWVPVTAISPDKNLGGDDGKGSGDQKEPSKDGDK